MRVTFQHSIFLCPIPHKILQIKTYRSIIMFVVVFGCEPLISYPKRGIQTELSYEQTTPSAEETTEVWRKLQSEAHL